MSSLLSLNTSEQTKLSMQDLVTSHARYPLTKVSLEAASKCFSVWMCSITAHFMLRVHF